MRLLILTCLLVVLTAPALMADQNPLTFTDTAPVAILAQAPASDLNLPPGPLTETDPARGGAVAPLTEPTEEPEDPDSWDWGLQLEGGVGTTVTKKMDFTVNIGARIGKFPNRFPIIGGHDFGADFALIGGNAAFGPWVRLVEGLSLAFYVWREDRAVTGDIGLRYSRPFDLNF